MDTKTTKKTNKRQNKNTHQRDKYLGEGSYGCVLQPEVKCVKGEISINKATKSSDTVSKLFSDKEDYIKELNAVKLVKKVDTTGTNILLPIKGCETTTEEVFKNNGAYNCEDITYSKNAQTNNIYQLIMPYGGIRYDEYIKKHNIKLKEFFAISESLFKALIALNNKKLCHYDIKGGNVLVNNKKAIIIDHTLVIPFTNVYTEKNLRRLKYAYYPYPPECIAYYKIYKYKINDDDFVNYQFNETLTGFGERRYNAYKSLIKKETYTNAINNIVVKLENIVKNAANTNKKYQDDLYDFMTPYANRIDVYSVGMLIVTVYEYIDYSNVNKKIKDEFVAFIKKLIEPDVFTRLTPKEAYEQFTGLYNKLK
jgi:serine/threonine protein kinase